jgi:4-hydroxy-tetrahydrodipicolinate synthase
MFNGSIVALITPFINGHIDETSLRNLVDWHVQEGTNGIVPCGTTGETATLTEDEWTQVVGTVVEQASGRVPVIAGTGTNSTRTTIERTLRAQEIGASGALIVTPYYNRPSQEGLYLHYSSIAEATTIPLVPYNVPGRTGVNLLPETVTRLSTFPNIVAIKESSGSPDQSSQILVGAGDAIDVLSGDDSLTLPIMSLGGVGVISVLANILPGPVARMTREFLDGNELTARQIHSEVFELTRALFLETNPVPVKTAAAWLGLCSDEVRLPLSPMSAANRASLITELERSPYIGRLAPVSGVAAADTPMTAEGSA